ncbi:putative nuclease HARBI1 [Pecten maximus]|uniref:putative nuclease HARBI1 n=1 Tax=Pecten maximus TaxID=6579 RepID=UPI00145826E7|nr:putative nuclease HARBI1 [Pecten maximus]
MCEELMPKYIKWPQGEHVSEVVKGFKALKHFPGVIGAIDCSQIQIKTPKYCPENYINRKSFPSVNLQAVCDSNMNILDVHSGWPGSVHDSRVFKNSNLYHRIQNDPDQVFPHNTHLIGDAAFGLETWMMTPFKDYGNLQARQRCYNYLQSSTRMVIERTFGALKGRFRSLKYLDMQNERIVKVILSYCVLHQLCLKHGDDGTQYIEEGIEEDTNASVEVMNGATNAEEKRTIIVQNL